MASKQVRKIMGNFIKKSNIGFTQCIHLRMIEEEELSADLRKACLEKDKQYKKLSQMSYYASLEAVEQLQIFTKSTCDVLCNVVFSFDSSKFDSDRKDQITLFIIRTLDDEVPKLKNKFSIAYIHDSLSSFIYFRSLMHLLPANYLSHLDHFYIVNASLLVRIVHKFSFGEINTFLRSRTSYVDTPHQIEEEHKITLGGNLTKSKLKLQNQNNQGQNQQVHRQMTTHELDPSILQIIKNKLYGKELSAYELSSNGFPKIMEMLVVKLYSTKSFLQAEGIMRKSCDVEQLEQLQNKIMEDENYQQEIRQFGNPYVLCGCLKKIFNNLYTPLFSYELYNEIIGFRSDGQKQNDISFVRGCIQKMQKLNRNVLLYISAFLIRGIIANKQQNKMSEYNLAVVFGPCFFRPKEYRLEDLMQSGKFSFIIKMILENFEELADKEGFEYFSLLEKQKMRFLQKQ